MLVNYPHSIFMDWENSENYKISSQNTKRYGILVKHIVYQELFIFNERISLWRFSIKSYSE